MRGLFLFVCGTLVGILIQTAIAQSNNPGVLQLNHVGVAVTGDVADGGDEVVRVPAAADLGAGEPRGAAGAGAGAAAAGCAAGAAAGAAGAPAAPPITATTVLIWTVLPAGTLISVSVPETGEGISASTLSVEISKIGSSRSTLSPTCLSQRVTVPSVTLSPSAGILNSIMSRAPLEPRR